MHRARNRVASGTGTRFLWRSVVLAGLLAVPFGAGAEAQSTEFRLSAGSVAFPTPTSGNYSSWPSSASGPVTDSVGVPFTVDRLANNTIRITSVLIRCLSVAGPKTCADFEWRNGSSGAWQSLSLLDSEVETRLVIPNLFNDPWTGTIWLRVRLDMTDPAPNLVTSNVGLSLSVTRE